MNHLKKRKDVAFSLWLLLVCSCSKPDYINPVPAVLKHWDIILDAKFEAPAITGRAETGTVSLDLYSDLVLLFSIHVSGISGSDAVTGAYLQIGDPLTNGPAALDLAAVFSNSSATGKLFLRSSFFDSLKYGKADFYINVLSAQATGGLARGQLEDPVIFAEDVSMAGINEVPAANTNASGLALFRLTAAKTLYNKISISKLESGDTLTFSHLHVGTPGTIGSIILQLGSTAADFNRVLVIPALSNDKVSDIQTANVYVNAHSQNHPSGLVRGQLR